MEAQLEAQVNDDADKLAAQKLASEKLKRAQLADANIYEREEVIVDKLLKEQRKASETLRNERLDQAKVDKQIAEDELKLKQQKSFTTRFGQFVIEGSSFDDINPQSANIFQESLQCIKNCCNLDLLNSKNSITRLFDMFATNSSVFNILYMWICAFLHHNLQIVTSVIEKCELALNKSNMSIFKSGKILTIIPAILINLTDSRNNVIPDAKNNLPVTMKKSCLGDLFDSSDKDTLIDGMDLRILSNTFKAMARVFQKTSICGNFNRGACNHGVNCSWAHEKAVCELCSTTQFCKCTNVRNIHLKVPTILSVTFVPKSGAAKNVNGPSQSVVGTTQSVVETTQSVVEMPIDIVANSINIVANSMRAQFKPSAPKPTVEICDVISEEFKDTLSMTEQEIIFDKSDKLTKIGSSYYEYWQSVVKGSSNDIYLTSVISFAKWLDQLLKPADSSVVDVSYTLQKKVNDKDNKGSKFALEIEDAHNGLNQYEHDPSFLEEIKSIFVTMESHQLTYENACKFLSISNKLRNFINPRNIIDISSEKCKLLSEILMLFTKCICSTTALDNDIFAQLNDHDVQYLDELKQFLKSNQFSICFQNFLYSLQKTDITMQHAIDFCNEYKKFSESNGFTGMSIDNFRIKQTTRVPKAPAKEPNFAYGVLSSDSLLRFSVPDSSLDHSAGGQAVVEDDVVVEVDAKVVDVDVDEVEDDVEVEVDAKVEVDEVEGEGEVDAEVVAEVVTEVTGRNQWVKPSFRKVPTSVAVGKVDSDSDCEDEHNLASDSDADSDSEDKKDLASVYAAKSKLRRSSTNFETQSEQGTSAPDQKQAALQRQAELDRKVRREHAERMTIRSQLAKQAEEERKARVEELMATVNPSTGNKYTRKQALDVFRQEQQSKLNPPKPGSRKGLGRKGKDQDQK